ncbi:MAG: MEDS domain-containing protein [Desulfuromonadales bacterium]|nr:MEDS domain-containing protein [Desulfuromonadales bacterium]
MTSRTTSPVGLADQDFPPGLHICMIYNSEDERHEIIEKFLKNGIDKGEKVAYIVEEIAPEAFCSWLAEKGLAGEVGQGPLQVDSARSTYYPSGRFDPDAMLARLQSFYRAALDADYSGCRVMGEMSWAAEGQLPGTDRLMEYESRVNLLVADHPLSAICQYDANRFDGATIFQCLKVHPYMIVHGQVVHNPFYRESASV